VSASVHHHTQQVGNILGILKQPLLLSLRKVASQPLAKHDLKFSRGKNIAIRGWSIGSSTKLLSFRSSGSLWFRLKLAAALMLEIRSWHHAQHEVSKQRHREFNITVGGTVDHSFVNQSIAQRRNRLQLHPE
jgi:hypothetical protein